MNIPRSVFNKALPSPIAKTINSYEATLDCNLYSSKSCNCKLNGIIKLNLPKQNLKTKI